jgi:hypothetical protein
LRIVTWLAGVGEKLDYRWSPVQILETEDYYPGLIEQVATVTWQKRIIREQMEGTGDVKAPDADG